jgi:hypothetical protein
MSRILKSRQGRTIKATSQNVVQDIAFLMQVLYAPKPDYVKNYTPV